MEKLELCLCVAVLLAIGASMAVSGANSTAATAEQQCQTDPGLLTQCSPFVLKGQPQTRPSQGCCDAVKDTDVSCVCKNLSHEMEQHLDMANVVYVAKYCGNPLGHGMQCGGYTIP